MDSIEIEICSWKKPAMHYSNEWQYLSCVAASCLTPNLVLDFLGGMNLYCKYLAPDENIVQSLLASIRDTSSAILALETIIFYPNFVSGPQYFVQERQSDCMELAIAIRLRIQVCSSNLPHLSSGNATFDEVVWGFLTAALSEHRRCKRMLDNLNSLDKVLATWLEVYKIFCVSRSYVGQVYTPQTHYYVRDKQWSTLLLAKRWNHTAEETELRLKVMEIEDTHGANMFNDFPPAGWIPEFNVPY